jgi:hypothetical protein
LFYFTEKSQNIMKPAALVVCCLFFSIILSAQWIRTNGLPGGNGQSFLHYGDTIVVGVNFKELYFSADHGQSWSVMPGSGGYSTYASAVEGHRMVFENFSVGASYWLSRTDDFGQTFHPIQSADTMAFDYLMVAQGYVYGSDIHGVYRTNDDGATWEYLTHYRINDIQYDGQRITGYSGPYVLQSKDLGHTWDTLLTFSGYGTSILQHDNEFFYSPKRPLEDVMPPAITARPGNIIPVKALHISAISCGTTDQFTLLSIRQF